jgi:hypothetical protein
VFSVAEGALWGKWWGKRVLTRENEDEISEIGKVDMMTMLSVHFGLTTSATSFVL